MTNLFGHSIRSDLVLLYVIEALVCFAAFYGILAMASPGGQATAGALAFAALLAICAGLVLGATGLYQPGNWMRSSRFFASTGIAGLLLLLVAQLAFPALMPSESATRVWPGHFELFAAFFVAVVLTRLGFTGVTRSGLLRRRILVVHSPGSDRDAARLVRNDAAFDIALTLSVQQDLDALLTTERLRDLQLWGVVAQDTDSLCPALRARLAQSGIRVISEPDFCERRLGRVDIARLPPVLTGDLAMPAERPLEAVLRRAFDITVSLGLLLATLPIVALAALAIKLEGPGPVFYRQERVGRGGKVFTLFKLRSMVVDAEVGGVPVWATQRDNRVTRVGRFIRLTRIDEIPQVLNVLRGDMAFVGPRPERPAIVEQLRAAIPHYDAREAVKPGITGWAQVNYPYGASIEDSWVKLSYDLYYVRRRSLFLDLLILIATVRVVLFQEGSR
jgi:exopolysaccharide biosynthesis polyprenyl glycosylphosphotransferase